MLHITPAERTVLNLLAQGTPAPEIARRIGLTASDLASYLATLFAKMGASNAAEAVASAFRRGLLVADDTART